MVERVEITVSDGVAEVVLNRPDKVNALDIAMFEALAEVPGRLAAEKGVRVVVLSGRGSGFCSGIDLNVLRGADGRFSIIESRSHGDCNLAQQVVMQWRAVPAPVIAAVHGTAFGGGFQLMLGADIRIAAPDTRMAIREAYWGLVPDMGGFALMHDLARDDVVRELVYTAREFDGSEAREMGFVTRIEADPLGAARDLAASIARLSPDAMRADKRLLNAAVQRISRSEILLMESREQQAMLASASHAEAVRAHMEKRLPRFED